MSKQPISSAFPFESKYIEVHGSQMHYIDVGEGDPILFLHGNPTSSYLWRNIIPYMSDRARCIAPDLIGMGKSDKPNIPYRFDDHYKYITGFIEALDLKQITLVIHDWGSGLGFNYAMQNENNIKGIAFMEAIIRPMSLSSFPFQFALLFRLFRTGGVGEFMNGRMNFFVKQMLPAATVRSLSAAEKAYYAEPYPDYASRKPTWQWPREIPFSSQPADNYATIQAYWEKLQQSPVPKLMLTATPGGIIPESAVPELQQKLPNLTTVHIGAGTHYVQEDNPHGIGKALQEWYATFSE